MITIQINKIKFGKEGKLIYNRPLNGKLELCELELLPASPAIEEAAIALVNPAIDIIGLNDERWESATVNSISLKWADPDNFGITIGLTNKDTYNDEPVCQNVSTRYVSPEQVEPDLRWNVLDVCKAAIDYIESQPEPPMQLDLESALQLPECEFTGSLS